MPVIENSIPAVLIARAQERPDEVAYTFWDYEVDPNGFAEDLTYGQLYNRAKVVADELLANGAVGDRAAILAPQSLDYVVAFWGALLAGFIAVPLPVPMFGVLDERVAAALRDCSPSVILTTSAAIDEVAQYAQADRGPAPTVIEVDLLDLDAPREIEPLRGSYPNVAYLQYTSGSTRSPAGCEITHENVIGNFIDLVPDYYRDSGEIAPDDVTIVSWLPFYHDMGLLVGVIWPIWLPRKSVLMSPVAFLQRPARWMQLLGTNTNVFTAAPNFAFELAIRKTTDDDLAGCDLVNIRTMLNGAERVNAGTIRRFYERFARNGFQEASHRPSYGLAEGTIYVMTSRAGETPIVAWFDYDQLSSGQAVRTEGGEGSTELVGYHLSGRPLVKIVDPETRVECPEGKVGEMWVHGPNTSRAYWRNPELTERCLAGRLVDPAPGVPEGPWLQTGDLGVVSEGDLFIIGRLKDLLIVDGRNHYPDDIEATIQKIAAGRCAAISVADDQTERLVAIIELKSRGGADQSAARLDSVKRDITTAILNSHQLRVADLVLVGPGSIPITSSGKTRRSACAELYRLDKFERLDNSA